MCSTTDKFWLLQGFCPLSPAITFPALLLEKDGQPVRLWLSAAGAIEPRGKSQGTGPGGSSQPSFPLCHGTVQATKLTERKGLTSFFLLFTLQGAKA